MTGYLQPTTIPSCVTFFAASALTELVAVDASHYDPVRAAMNSWG